MMTRKTSTTSTFAAAALLSSALIWQSGDAFSTTTSAPQHYHHAPIHTTITTAFRSSSALSMSPSYDEELAFLSRRTQQRIEYKHSSSKRSQKKLSAVAIGTMGRYDDFSTASSLGENVREALLPVLSTALLITANTVGASCLVLDQLAQGPGFLTTAAVAVGVYLVNLVSGLALAEVAIEQYESSGQEPPSSFKDFSYASFKSPLIANLISAVSVGTNACVMAFTLAKVGEMGAALTGGDPLMLASGFAALLGGLVSTQSSDNLSKAASVCVAVLFASFAGLLLPGLAAVPDAMTTLMAPGIADDWMGSVAQATPVLLLSLVYQNIVPSVVKILDYDRTKTAASLALGSFIPLVMYLAWIFASLGGGIDTSVGMAGPLLGVFSAATIVGSSIGTSMSVAEEFDSFLKKSAKTSTDGDIQGGVPQETATAGIKANDVFSVPAVAATMGVSMVGTYMCANGGDLTTALSLAGSFGTPLLYGVIPAAMAWNQNKKRSQSLVPGGSASLGALGLAATGFVGEELVHVMGDAVSMVS